MALAAARYLSILSTTTPPPLPPTQSIRSAPANFFSSLALFLQRNKQSKKYWGEKQDRGLRFIYNGGKLQWGITYTQLNKACTNISVKVTIIKRKNNYLGVDDVLQVYGGGSSVRVIWPEVP